MSYEYLGKDIALDSSGGILLENNDFRQVSGIDCVIQQIITRLSTPLGGLFYDASFGSNLHKFIGRAKNEISVKQFINAIKETLEAEPLVRNESIEVKIKDNGTFGLFAVVTFLIFNYDTKLNLVVSADRELKIWEA